MRFFAISLIAFVMSCSKQDAADRPVAQEEHAIALASAKCQCSPEMPWLRDIIRQSELEAKYKGVIYAIDYSNGVAFMQQPWVSSCYACLVFDCEGNELTAASSIMEEIISGAKEENIIYSTTL